jgi:asparagine synthase (glutamine-hydrolysing)
MCGIYGYYSLAQHNLPAAVLAKMAVAIQHRGPDEHGCFTEQGVAIGNQRLSIIDVAHGHQPFISEDGNIAVVQNGEVYNHIELAAELKKQGSQFATNSDTEVILRLYERDGIDFIHKLNGMFAIAIYDKTIDKLFIIRDRVGIKPLYYYHKGEQLFFASEIKSILAADVERKINYQALDCYLAFNYVPPPLTMFENIQHIMPGHYVEISANSVVDKTWWDVRDIQVKQQINENDWIEEFNTTLEDAVKLRMRADVPFGAFLSGGVDSSSVVGLMSKVAKHPVKTFSIGFHDAKYDESPYALAAAKRFNTEHYNKIVDREMLNFWPEFIYYCDQPHGDVSFMPTYQVSKLAKQQVKMVLTGDGADELFAGYDKYLDYFTDIDSLNSTDRSLHNYLPSLSLFDLNTRGNLYNDQFKHNCSFAENYIQPLLASMQDFDTINQALLIDFIWLLPGNNLVKPDRMGMAVSLEARTPFLDHRMVNLAFSTPGKFKLQNGETKYLYKKAVAPLIGNELAYRKKQMFTVPIGDWFRTQLGSFAKDVLFNNNDFIAEVFNTNEIERMLNTHLSGTANYTRQIRALISLAYWYQQVFVPSDTSANTQ